MNSEIDGNLRVGGLIALAKFEASPVHRQSLLSAALPGPICSNACLSKHSAGQPARFPESRSRYRTLANPKKMRKTRIRYLPLRGKMNCNAREELCASISYRRSCSQACRVPQTRLAASAPWTLAGRLSRPWPLPKALGVLPAAMSFLGPDSSRPRNLRLPEDCSWRVQVSHGLTLPPCPLLPAKLTASAFWALTPASCRGFFTQPL